MNEDDGGFARRESKQDQLKDYATMKCSYCGETFTEENPCWNDDGLYFADEDETIVNGHLDGECKKCAAKHGNVEALRRSNGDAEPGRGNW